MRDDADLTNKESVAGCYRAIFRVGFDVGARSQRGYDSSQMDRGRNMLAKMSLVALEQNESAPTTGALPNCIRSDLQAATLVGWTSRTLPELAIGIARGFIASGISRTRSMCRSPFSRLAPLTCI